MEVLDTSLEWSHGWSPLLDNSAVHESRVTAARLPGGMTRQVIAALDPDSRPVLERRVGVVATLVPHAIFLAR